MASPPIHNTKKSHHDAQMQDQGKSDVEEKLEPAIKGKMHHKNDK
jgi:hypothetical protein